MKNKKALCYFANVEVEIPIDALIDCSSIGPVDESVAYWITKIDFGDLTIDKIKAGLKETGGWSMEELNADDDETNFGRALWIMACDWKENESEVQS